MGKSSRRATKNGVDDAMTVAKPAAGGDGGGWVYGSTEGGISMEALEGGVPAVADGGEGAAAAPKKRALTAGLRVGKKTATVLRGITKRKKKMIAKGIAHAERKVGKQKKNTAKIGIRQEVRRGDGGSRGKPKDFSFFASKEVASFFFFFLGCREMALSTHFEVPCVPYIVHTCFRFRVYTHVCNDGATHDDPIHRAKRCIESNEGASTLVCVDGCRSPCHVNKFLLLLLMSRGEIPKVSSRREDADTHKGTASLETISTESRLAYQTVMSRRRVYHHPPCV